MRFRRGWCRWLLFLSPIEHTYAQPWLGKFPYQYRRYASRSEASDTAKQNVGHGVECGRNIRFYRTIRRVPARAITGPEILTPPV
jgi:hypothetical protein